MNSQEKKRLNDARPRIVKSLDVQKVLHALVKDGSIYPADETNILKDPRRRVRVHKLLDLLETKPRAAYDEFLSQLESQTPHLFLALTDWDDEDDGEMEEYTIKEHTRTFLIDEIDAAAVLPRFKKQDMFSQEEKDLIKNESNVRTRTEAFLDIVELKDPEIYDIFLDAIGDTYPHVYLELTGQNQGDDGLGDLYD